MSWDNKVVWSEGLFLQPQHFQQQDRYVERLVRGAVAGLRPYGWGVSDLQIDRDMLSLGKLAVTACRGTMADGTPFDIPADVDHPRPLDIGENVRNAVVYLVLPVRQPGAVEFQSGDDEASAARYAARELEARDCVSGAASTATVPIGRMRIRFALEREERAGFVSLGVARVVEVRADKQVVLDDRYIPPTLNCRVSPVLSGFITELHGLIHHRAEALAGRVSASGTRGAAEIADFLLLQTCNRSEPLLAHLMSAEDIHPESFYRVAIGLAGELATFTEATKRPAAFPVYRHDDLAGSFRPVMAALRQSLSAVLEQTAVPVPLQERRYGIRVAAPGDRSLFTTAVFVLAVRADMPAEALRRNFPNQVKIGPVEQIRELVNVALPGIGARPLPVAPRQIPFHAGVAYFELDRSNQYWKSLANSGGLAIHVAGEFPSLQMECWAIRG